jgi:hypothetical protein
MFLADRSSRHSEGGVQGNRYQPENVDTDSLPFVPFCHHAEEGGAA